MEIIPAMEFSTKSQEVAATAKKAIANEFNNLLSRKVS